MSNRIFKLVVAIILIFALIIGIYFYSNNNKTIIMNDKHSINNTPLTAADFFEIFFFENVNDPAGEVDRFMAYYEGRGWKYQDGTPVTDFERAAKDWKPLKAGKRFDAEALRWYKAVWITAKARIDNAFHLFLGRITNLRRTGQQLALVFRDEGSARKVSAFITDNDLAGDWSNTHDQGGADDPAPACHHHPAHRRPADKGAGPNDRLRGQQGHAPRLP